MPRAARIFLPLVGANVAAWVWAFAAFGGRPMLLGIALLAYVFGLRHALDADHIAAIDNVVRKLIQRRRPSETTGLFFSLGHSTVVVLAAVVVSAGAAASRGRLEAWREIGGVVGTSVSATFLLVIALVNLAILRGVWTSFQRVRRGGSLDEEGLEALLSGRGFLSRLLRPLFDGVDRSSRMYLLGLLFGLGFDTATEIGLLAISATQAAQGLSLTATLVFPALFTAGMALVDTTDSVLMTRAYGWAFVDPVRKLWYNLTITGMSVAVALLVGGVEALGLIADKLGLSGAGWRAAATLGRDSTSFGLAVVALFVLSWLASVAVFRLKGLGQPTSEKG